jgi:thioesterase DpgC
VTPGGARLLGTEPPAICGDYKTDCEQFSRFWEAASGAVAREARDEFLRAHARALYDELTGARSRFLRVEDLAYAAADAVPGLVPGRAEVAVESERRQGEKEGIEIDQGVLLSHVLASEIDGRHLCHAMLLPRRDALDKLTELERDGAVDLGAAVVERRGSASYVELRNPSCLNAEDDTTIDATELAVDLALLDPQTEICVLRGGFADHPKYAGRRVFGSGINLTRLYHGKVPFLWYLTRELGFVNKFLRGLARPDTEPDAAGEDPIEKPWVAAVDAFAIGGHCQYLLTMDYVVAADDAYLTLPARKEGIVPGAANLRLPRFVGARLARQAILAERRLDCASPEGRLVCDEVVRPDAMDAAVEEAAERLTSSGAVSAASNRRAFRSGEEPLDAFRRYVSVYAREQARCHFSEALIANLEHYWNAPAKTVR